MSRFSICLVVHEDTSASRYYRAVLPLRHCGPLLAAEGIDLALPGKGDDLSGHDAYVFYRNVPPDLFPFVTSLVAKGVPTYWDIDDNFHAVPEWSPASKSFKLHNRAICMQMAAFADRISVSTAPLREALGHQDKTAVLPNLIDPDDWPVPRARNDGVCRVLWQGSATHEEDLRVIVPALRAARKEFGGRVEFVFAGYCPKWIAEDPEVDPVILAGWPVSSHARALTMLAPDVGLAPLSGAEGDLPFNVCKSAIKWYEYTMAGAVTIASDVGPYADAITDGRTGMLAGDSDAWCASLIAAVTHLHAGEVGRVDRHVGMQQDARLSVRCYDSWSTGLKIGLAAWLDFYRGIAAASRRRASA